MASSRTQYPQNKKRKGTNVELKPSKRRPPSALSLSPFYSFSSHWSYVANQYLCLTSWGTCVGGINDQYDNLLEHEASVPWIEESIKNAQYNKQNVRYSYVQNKNKTALYNAQEIKGLKPEHEVSQHKYKHEPEAKQFDDTDIAYSQLSAQNKAVLSIAASSQSSQSAQNTAYASTAASSEAKQFKDNKAISYPQLSAPNKAAASSQGAHNKDDILPTAGCVEPDKDEQLAVDKNTTHGKDTIHMKGQSFGKRLSMFDEAVQSKRKLDEEETNRTKRRISGTQNRNWKQHETDGISYVDQISSFPVSHGVRRQIPRKMSTKEYSKHMKTKENPSAIVVDDPSATASALDKIKYFQRITTPKPGDL